MNGSARYLLALLAGLLAVSALGCTGTADQSGSDDQPSQEELPVGDVDDMGVKADGWGAALNCKPIPNVPALANPEIVVSLDGLTLHLRDKGGTYDRVFPIGPGALDPATGKSRTPVSTGTPTGLFYTGRDTREVSDGAWGYYYPCRIWWHDEDTNDKRPVFAGLPFIRLEGPSTSGYAIHGPIDAFTLPSGGILRRGYVSHGCMRMQATDIVEVYARIKGKAHVPVRIQREVERDTFGHMVDVSAKWIGQECEKDSDCNYTGGLCRQNAYGRGFCTQACTGSCPDRQGYNSTRCVSDGAGGGMCTVTGDAVNNFCKGLYGRTLRKGTRLFGRTAVADVCLPGTAGNVGDPCLGDGECGQGGICEKSGVASGPGFCSKGCTTSCAAGSVCTTVDNAKRCVETCWGQDACALGLACEDGVSKLGGGTARACVP